MKKMIPSMGNSSFENIKRIDENGVEYWEARDLMTVLEYRKWENFEKVIEKAKITCTQSEQSVDNHFPDARKVIKAGKGAVHTLKDYKLSRYACYLIAQNASSEKKAVALAQTYFAVKTRSQEVYEQLSADEKRLLTREEVIDHNKKLFRTAKDSGVNNFGLFNDHGYKGLYGLSSRELKSRKSLGKDSVLDRAGATELAANLFRITQTDDQLKSKLEKSEVVGEYQASRTHFVVGGKVRKAIKDIGGTMPEKLPAEEHIKEVKKRLGGKSADKLQGGKEQLSE